MITLQKARKTLEPLFPGMQIKEAVHISNKGDVYNQIFRIDTSLGSLLLKQISDLGQKYGEETITDAVYGALVDQYVGQTIGYYDVDYVKVLAVDFSKKSELKSSYILVDFVQGTSVDNIDAGKDVALEGMMQFMYEVYKVFPAQDVPGPLRFPIERMLNKTICRGVSIEELGRMIRNMQNYTENGLDFFLNDIENTSLQSRIKRRLTKIATEFKGALVPNAFHLVHGDLKLSNLIKTDRGIQLIDWSRAHYGDIATDLADIVVSTVSTFGTDEGQKNLDELTIRVAPDPAERTALIRRVSFYYYFKIFSIARVFYEDELDTVSQVILNAGCNLSEVIALSGWLEGKHY